MPSPRAPQPPPVSVARGSVLFFASSIVGSAGFFVAALLLARALGPAGRGSVAFITVTALVCARIAKAGLGQATSVLAAQQPGARGALLANLLWFSLVTSLAVGGAIVGVANIQIYRIGSPSTASTPICTIGPGRRIGYDADPSWSSDGRRLLWWESGRGIFSTPVTADPGCGLSPRGSSVAA